MPLKRLYSKTPFVLSLPYQTMKNSERVFCLAHEWTRKLEDIRKNMAKAVVGKQEAIDLILTAMIAGGHVLIEDVPGLGKTTMVWALARSVDCTFSRIQFTPDVLPSDVTGYTMFNLKTGERETVPGGVMAQIVLADEINRTSPKTQSSLLEAMQENQVTIDGVSTPLPQPFMVLATQNPVELTGTYPLPEAQLDRFLMRIQMGYPSKSEELDILTRYQKNERPALAPVASAQDVLALRAAHAQVRCQTAVLDYIVSLCAATRENELVALGVSPRGSLALMHASMAYAMLSGRDYVMPEDVQRLVQPVLAHRLVLTAQAGFKNVTAQKLLEDLVRTVPVPGVS
jgi:MoxR-like ATPase